MQRTKIKCPLCGQEISKSNYIKHQRRHENHPETFKDNVYHVDHDGLNCKFCGKKCKNKNSLAQHELRCPKNSNRKDYIKRGLNSIGHKSWNKGLTKETDERIASAAIKCSNSLRGRPGRKHTEPEKLHLRECALRNGLGGFYMRRGVYYNGIKLDSSYEVTLAENLDSNHICWERPGRFIYHMENKIHYYTPDFYLPDYNVYLDPKNDFLINEINPNLGYKDSDKIKQVEIENNIHIIILNKNQLSWDYIKTVLP